MEHRDSIRLEDINRCGRLLDLLSANVDVVLVLAVDQAEINRNVHGRCCRNCHISSLSATSLHDGIEK